MTSFAVLRERGAAWDASRPLAGQLAWDEHASFMNALAEEGFVVLGGPLGDGDSFLLVINAESEDDIRARLTADPWTPMRLLRVASIEPWQILLGDPAMLA